MTFQMRLVKGGNLTATRPVAARPGLARPRQLCVRAESPKTDAYNEPGPRPAGAPHESEGPTKGPASPRFQAPAADYHPASDSPKAGGDVFPTVESAVGWAGGGGAKARADEAWEKMPTADQAQQQGATQRRRPKMDKERTSVEGMVSDSDDMLPDNADDEIITSTKPFIKQLYKETAGTHDYSDMSSEEESESNKGPMVADAVSDADDMLPDDPVAMDEELMFPQRPSIKAVYDELADKPGNH